MKVSTTGTNEILVEMKQITLTSSPSDEPGVDQVGLLSEDELLTPEEQKNHKSRKKVTKTVSWRDLDTEEPLELIHEIPYNEDKVRRFVTQYKIKLVAGILCLAGMILFFLFLFLAKYFKY